MSPHSLGLHPAAKAGRDAFGCQSDALADDEQIAGGDIDFIRKGARAGAPGQVAMPATERGFLVGLSLAGGHRRRIFAEHHSSLHDFEENSVYLRRFSDPYKADLSGSFDFVLMEISQSSLRSIADEADIVGVTELRQTIAEPDPLLGGLTRSLFASARSPVRPNKVLTDELCTAIAIHIVHRYGNGQFRTQEPRRRFSPRNTARSKELLEASIDSPIGIDRMAAETGMSRRAFLGAFQETIGEMPHQWLAGQQIARAQALLQKSGMSLDEVSEACGFSEIPEFEQMFKASTGLAPDAWRRARRS